MCYNGYVYRHLRSRQQNHYYRCEMDECHGTAILRGTAQCNDAGGNVSEGKPHSHEVEEGRVEILEMQQALREEGERSTAPPRAILQTHRQHVPVKASGNLPSEDSQRQLIQRARRRTYPREPPTKGEIEIPHRMQTTNEGERFLLFDTFDPDDPDIGADEAENRIIAFATERNLRLLAESEMWFLDGTFKACPQLFAQLYTINALVESRTFPLVYALLPSKTQEVYETLFRELVAAAAELEPALELRPLHLMFDFERAALNAAGAVFTGAEVHGCLFHLPQNIYRKVQEEGLTLDYRDDEDVQLSIKKLVALAFLPAEEIPEGFRIIKDVAPNNVLPVYRYMEENYVRGRVIHRQGKGRRPRTPPRHPPTFPPHLWSVHRLQELKLYRSNNVQEAWHSRFNTIVQRAHVGIFQIITEFRKEQHRVEQEISRTDHGKKGGKTTTRSVREREQRIGTVFGQFDTLPRETFIRRIARNMELRRRDQREADGEDGSFEEEADVA